jgi:hypothetical protein
VKVPTVRKRTLANRDSRGDESPRTNSPPITQSLRTTDASEPLLPPAMGYCPWSGYALRSVRDHRKQEISTPSILGKPLSARCHCIRDG